MIDCIFCKIINKELQGHVVFENEGVIAFLDIYPRSPGHTMVIPKQHVSTLGELNEKSAADLFRIVGKLSRELRSKLNADGLTIGINEGDVSGQTVKHLHVHIIPRFLGDGGGSVHSVVNNPPKESIESILELIRKP